MNLSQVDIVVVVRRLQGTPLQKYLGNKVNLIAEVIITRTCLIAADILLIVATWTTLYRRASFSRERRRATLADVLLHDGESDKYIILPAAYRSVQGRCTFCMSL